ncbi:flavin monoamine oxidase family protein [Alteromonas sp. CYL-A6]|uniref:flavin monoamine oxidase family protein n=1 Tax=Alteromonas nitratireducens TaxID=3390813 RepID=UPI0034A9F320
MPARLAGLQRNAGRKSLVCRIVVIQNTFGLRPEVTLNVVAIGAGLTGLYLSWKLSQHHIPFTLLEARARPGGRICSENGFDLGPAWFWGHQQRFIRLLDELNLTAFEQASSGVHLYQSPHGIQTMPGQQMPVSWRVRGGMEAVVDALTARLAPDCVHYRQPADRITLDDTGNTVTVRAGGDTWQASHVVVCLPPRLAAGSLCFSPALPSEAIAAMRNTPTWMAGHAKALIRYPSPFWREQGKSGMVISHTGPLAEIHDASLDDGTAALFGFFGWSPEMRRAKQSQIESHICQQLTTLFGNAAARPLSVTLCDWAQDQYTATSLDQEPLTYHPVYGLANTRFWQTRLQFAATETDRESGGYMEGALAAAEHAFSGLLHGQER